ncbi:MAG: hypothetical protein ACN4GZ_20430 [Acidimicrobiales bacterium]
MTEIPEHLLKRSAARRGKSTGDEGAAGESSASTAVETSTSSGPAQPPAIVEAAAAIPRDPEPQPEKPVPSFVRAALSRKKMPMWAMAIPFLALLWAYSFAGTMQQPEVEDPLFIESAALYSSQGCAGCHGAGGGGGVGYAFSDGEIYATFPDPIDQIVHIARGSAAIAGEEYGDAARPGGGRVAGERGVMPNYNTGAITQNELELIVFHERATLGGEDTSGEAYQEWMEHMREVAEGVLPDHAVDLDLFLSCANPEYTPGATGTPEDPEECPGPHAAEDEEVASE